MAETSKLIRNVWRINSKHGNMDYIQELLYRDIDEYRLKTFDNFTLEVFVLPSADAAVVHDSNGRWIGFDRYNFDPYSKDLKPMRVRTSEGRVQIWRRKKWRSIANYLKHLKPSDHRNAPLIESGHETQRRMWDQQQRWWIANGKTFRLMDLPPEVREVFYAYAFGPMVEPYPTSKARKLGKGNLAILARMPNTSLLRTSRLIYQEASNILFKYTPFFVDRLGVLSQLLQHKEQSSRIRQLELALSHIEFLNLFGFQTRELEIFEPRVAAHALKNLELDRLEIRFAAPSSVTEVEWLDNACQKTVVNWILDAAWPFIRMHSVELTGYVKNSSRDLFETHRSGEKERVALWQRQRFLAGAEKGDLREYYNWLDEEEGGVYLDVSKADEQLAKRESEKEIPPKCHCKRRCDSRRWTSRD